MSHKTLVAYVSRSGSTTEVAEAIAETLRADGTAVDLVAGPDVTSLDDYDLIVFGAPLYIGNWPTAAHQFLRSHKAALANHRVVIFALGPTELDDAQMAAAEDQLANVLAKYEWLKPLQTKMFVGRFDVTKMTGWHRLLAKLPAMKKLPAQDFRDWDGIRAWAHQLATTTPH